MFASYNHKLADGRSALTFVKLLARWKGSLYKLLWVDLAIYVAIFFVIHFTYHGLEGENKKNFEEIVKYCEKMKTSIPLSFLLGFFVAGVVDRWWKMYMAIPWLNRMAFLADGSIIGHNVDQVKKVKMTFVRYLVLSWILLMHQISKQIQKRFSTNFDNEAEHSVRNLLTNFNSDRTIQGTFRKIITDSEIQAFEKIAAKNFAKASIKYVPEYWVPLQWASRVLQNSLVNGYIVDMRTTIKLIEELDQLRNEMHILQKHCDIMLPLVYTQVVIIAVYSYFFCLLFSSQFPIKDVINVDNINTTVLASGYNLKVFFYPLFTIFQFMFIMGWLKVAICLLNPFGDAEEDFKSSDILDANIDICWRCANAELSSFPENLIAPSLQSRNNDNQNMESFQKFIDAIEDDLEEIEPPLTEHHVVALEINPSTFLKIKNTLLKFIGRPAIPLPNEFPDQRKELRNRRSSLMEDTLIDRSRFISAKSLPILNNHQSTSSYGDMSTGSNALLISKTYSKGNNI